MGIRPKPPSCPRVTAPCSRLSCYSLQNNLEWALRLPYGNAPVPIGEKRKLRLRMGTLAPKSSRLKTAPTQVLFLQDRESSDSFLDPSVHPALCWDVFRVSPGKIPVTVISREQLGKGAGSVCSLGF